MARAEWARRRGRRAGRGQGRSRRALWVRGRLGLLPRGGAGLTQGRTGALWWLLWGGQIRARVGAEGPGRKCLGWSRWALWGATQDFSTGMQ